ncbi:MAG: flagellar basal body-associated protein FliL [Francisellaceae bacterium]|jgi:flagellar basal body-associated protein FliL
MSSTKKQNLTLIRIIAIIFAILIVLGFVGLLMNSAEKTSTKTHEATHVSSSSTITVAALNHQSDSINLAS